MEKAIKAGGEHTFASFNWPRHRRAYGTLLGNYLMRRMLWSMVSVALVLGGLMAVLDTVELLRMAAGKDLSATSLVRLSLLKLPTLMLELLPFVVLLATLLFLQGLNRRHELVALRAAGLPARRFLLAPFMLVLMLGVLAVGVFNPVAATLSKKYERTYAQMFPDQARGVVTRGGSLWLRQEDGTHRFFIHARRVQPDGRTLDHATVLMFHKDGAFALRLDAAVMVLHEGRWRMEDVYVLNPRQMVNHEPVVSIPTTLTREAIATGFQPPETMTVWELGKYLDVLEESGWPSGEYAMAYQRLLALPAFLLAMFLLAVPVALRFVRGSGMAMTLGSGVGLGFGFYLLGNLFATYGLAGRLDNVLAAWAPAAIAVLCAVALLLYLREE